MRISLAGWVLAGLSLGVLSVLGPDAAGLVRDAAGPSFPEAAVAIASLVALALATWSLLCAVLILVAGSTRLVAAITPHVMRRALVVGASGALVIGPVHAAQAEPPAEAAHVQRHALDGLPLPDRPDVVEVVHRDAPAAVVQVRPGDTLWAIAARMLPSTATDAEIAHATRWWYDANRDVIGDDPSLIFPTQHLTPPTGKDRP